MEAIIGSRLPTEKKMKIKAQMAVQRIQNVMAVRVVGMKNEGGSRLGGF